MDPTIEEVKQTIARVCAEEQTKVKRQSVLTTDQIKWCNKHWPQFNDGRRYEGPRQ